MKWLVNKRSRGFTHDMLHFTRAYAANHRHINTERRKIQCVNVRSSGDLENILLITKVEHTVDVETGVYSFVYIFSGTFFIEKETFESLVKNLAHEC